MPGPGEYLRLRPFLHNRHAETKTKTKQAQVKEQIKAPGKIQLSDEEIANLSDARFKMLVIRMLTDIIEYSRKMKEEVKAVQSEIKENIQENNSEGK